MVEREERGEIGIYAAKTEFLSVTEGVQCFSKSRSAELRVTIQPVKQFPKFSSAVLKQITAFKQSFLSQSIFRRNGYSIKSPDSFLLFICILPNIAEL